MSTDDIVSAVGLDNGTVLPPETQDVPGLQFNGSDLQSALNNSEIPLLDKDSGLLKAIDPKDQYELFEKFVIVEIVMTTLELIISVLAASKMPRWRRNYRNQMLMQLTLARFIKRLIFIFQFLEYYEKIPSTSCVTNMLNCFQFYIDFVIVILVFFFIKHMYNSLIIVLIKVSQNNFYRVLVCSWLIPVPISIIFTVMIVTDVLDKWHVYLLICSIFRWPLIFTGTGLYITIIYRVLTDKIRQFAISLAMVTFLLCLIINIYLFSKDIIELWCFDSFLTELVSYVSGFFLNLLILTLYVILIIVSYNKTHALKSDLPDYSLAEAKCENVITLDNE